MNLSKSYEDCVKQHLFRANKDDIKTTFEQILELVRETAKIAISPQVKALYLQTIISAVNENDSYWQYNPGNIHEKMAATKKMLLDVPLILAAIQDSEKGGYITASKFLHYVAKNLDLWCPFTKPPLTGEEQTVTSTYVENVTPINRKRSKQ
jgi:hypothetical protein